MKVLKIFGGMFAGIIMLISPTYAYTEVNKDKILQNVSITKNLENYSLTKQTEIKCLALALYHEARGSTIADIRAVGFATRNRVLKRKTSYCSVIWEPNQYSWTKKNSRATRPTDSNSWGISLHHAHDIIVNNPPDTTNGATSFYSVRISTPSWARGKTKLKIGGHYFVRV